MPSKIRIKMGAIEVECEGSEEFLKKELPDILAAVSKLHGERGAGSQGGEDAESEGREKLTRKNGHHGGAIGTTATIAGKLNAKSGPDLMIAAAARLTVVQNREDFSRKELLDEMKTASGYYSENVRKNFTNYLRGKVRSGDLLEPRSGYYCLSKPKRDEISEKLAS